jgi:hypothetical protein
MKVLSTVIVLVAFSSFAMADSIAPTSVTKTLGIGESYTVSKTVTVDKDSTAGKVDVFFLADTTGSMGPEIASVKAAASSILSTTAGLGDLAFGVGEYRDTGDAFVYRLNQDITTSSAAAQTGINAWSASGGGDFYEANMFALQSVANDSSWRAGSERILVWFGDAPGHDPSAGGATEASATAALVANNISVQALDTGSLNGTGQATRIAAATGGTYQSGVNSANIVAIINAAIAAAVANYSTVGIDASEAPLGVNVAVVPGTGYSGAYDRSVTRTFHFDVTFTGTAEGSYTFNLYGTVDGGRVATEVDNITVSAVPLPASAWLGLTLLGSLGAFRSVRRRKMAA